MSQVQRLPPATWADPTHYCAPGGNSAGGTATGRHAAVCPPSRGPIGAGWRIGASASVLGIQCVVGYHFPAIGVVLAGVDALAPVAVCLILIIAILRGSSQTCERVFRLLRWITGRAEPPGPGPSASSD